MTQSVLSTVTATYYRWASYCIKSIGGRPNGAKVVVFSSLLLLPIGCIGGLAARFFYEKFNALKLYTLFFGIKATDLKLNKESLKKEDDSLSPLKTTPNESQDNSTTKKFGQFERCVALDSLTPDDEAAKKVVAFLQQINASWALKKAPSASLIKKHRDEKKGKKALCYDQERLKKILKSLQDSSTSQVEAISHSRLQEENKKGESETTPIDTLRQNALSLHFYVVQELSNLQILNSQLYADVTIHLGPLQPSDPGTTHLAATKEQLYIFS